MPSEIVSTLLEIQPYIDNYSLRVPRAYYVSTLLEIQQESFIAMMRPYMLSLFQPFLRFNRKENRFATSVCLLERVSTLLEIQLQHMESTDSYDMYVPFQPFLRFNKTRS